MSAGAPEGVVSCIEIVPGRYTGAYESPMTAVIPTRRLALVKAAYSSGKPALEWVCNVPALLKEVLILIGSL